MPVMLSAVLTSAKALPTSRRRVPGYNRKAVFDAIGSTDPEIMMTVHLFERYLLGMPAIPTDVDPSSHEHLIAEYFHEGLERFFPPAQRVQKQEYLSLATFSLVLQRALGLHSR